MFILVYKWDVKIPELTGRRKRRGYVYLPDCYDEDPERRFPVLYMFDGHNVFFDSDATYGKSWGMKDYMDYTQTPMIIVAIECNHKGTGRLSEYSPYGFYFGEQWVRGKGQIYMDWLVNTLKPQIDSELRTLPDRAHTMIAGSSMGGLMSLYAITAYNHIFGGAACLSPSIWVNPKKLSYLIRDTEFDPETIIYMDYGSQEMSNHDDNMSFLLKVQNLLLRKGTMLTFRIVPGGSHCEASWEQQIPIFMKCLGM